MEVLQHLSSSIITPPPSQLRSRFHFRRCRRRRRLLPSSSASCELSPPRQATNGISRRQLIGCIHIAAAISLSPLGSKALAAEDPLSGIAFVPNDPSHGFLMGTRQTILETKDGGISWVARSILFVEDEDFNYRFNSISFKRNEGWVVGKPAILLYTADAGDTWQRIPLSAQLPVDTFGGSRRSNKEERPRFFDSKAKRTCWDKAKQVPGRDPERWRMDAAGNIVCKNLHTCDGCLCYEYDHIIPFSKGGESVAENCQILQTRVNRLKSDKNGLDQQLLKGYSCDIKLSDEELDIIEMAVYGSVTRPAKNCIVGSINSLVRKYKSKGRMITCNLHKND